VLVEEDPDWSRWQFALLQLLGDMDKTGAINSWRPVGERLLRPVVRQCTHTALACAHGPRMLRLRL
jgi:hypothetical protein